MMDVQHVIVQGTPFCNINCSYCYLPHRTDRSRMSFDTMRTVFTKIFAAEKLSSRISVVWHSGEPLVLGTDYYRQAFDLVNELAEGKTRILHSINTNGTLIDDDWCALFKSYKVNVGASIDGPAEFHDASRVTRAGKGTHAAAMRGVAKLQEHNLPFYVISVLTRAALERPDGFYDFYRNAGIKVVCFNVEEIEGVHAKTSMVGDDVQALFESFLRAFWQRVVADGHKIKVREFENMLRDMTWPDNRVYPHTQLEPFGHVNVDWRGRFSTFSPELMGQKSERYGDFIVGDFATDTLEDALKNPVLVAIKESIDIGVEKCRASCQYFAVCGAGTPVNKFFENGDFDTTETMFCRMNKMAVANVMLDILEQAVAREDAELWEDVIVS